MGSFLFVALIWGFILFVIVTFFRFILRPIHQKLDRIEALLERSQSE
jgi:hypothetical protein